MLNAQLKFSGKTPPQIGVPKNLSHEDMLLYAAWMLGFEKGDSIHRQALFAIVQSQIANKLEPSLQRTLENSALWGKKNSGYYALSDLGGETISKIFGPVQEKLILPEFILFSRTYQGTIISIEMDILHGRLTPKVDDKETPGNQVIKFLTSKNANFKLNEGTTYTSRIWAWIIQDNDYSWEYVMKNDKGKNGTQMIKNLEGILNIYLEISSKSAGVKIGPQLKSYFEGFIKGFTESGLEEKYPEIQVTWSVGKGRWTKTPWIAFLDKRITTTTTKGFYCVILFRQDMSGFYLTFNQGTTNPIAKMGEKEGKKWLKDQAILIAKEVLGLEKNGFILDSNIDLRANKITNAKDYEIATIAHKLYEKGKMPNEDQWVIDLDNLLSEYQNYIGEITGNEKPDMEEPQQNSNWLFQVNEKYYDIMAAVKNLKELSFMVHQNLNKIKKGDKVYIWLSGPKGGVVAVSTTVSPVMIMEDHDNEKKYYLTESKFEGEVKRVRLLIEKIVDPVLTKDVITHDPILKDLIILKAPQGTNFLITNEQAERIDELISQVQEVNNEPIYTMENLLFDTGINVDVMKGWLIAIERKKQAILYGPPGTGKTYIARAIAKYLIGEDGYKDFIQFHPAYAYEDFIQGIRPKTREDGSLEYEMIDGRLLEFCKHARAKQGISVLVIDEINRANLSRVFGELMFLLEYRNERVSLAGGNSFSIPENVRILGTMNTADRSIALVDHALRRRFAFIRLYPDFNILMKFHETTGFNPDGLIKILKKINKEISDPNYFIGITFFLNEILSQNMEAIWKMEIEPYLEEFFFDAPDKVEMFRWEMVEKDVIIE